jgi:hypothetical protein
MIDLHAEAEGRGRRPEKRLVHRHDCAGANAERVEAHLGTRVLRAGGAAAKATYKMAIPSPARLENTSTDIVNASAFSCPSLCISSRFLTMTFVALHGIAPY